MLKLIANNIGKIEEKVNSKKVESFVKNKINQLNANILKTENEINTKKNKILMLENKPNAEINTNLIDKEKRAIDRLENKISLDKEEILYYKNTNNGIYLADNGLVLCNGNIVNPFNVNLKSKKITQFIQEGYFDMGESNTTDVILFIKDKFVTKKEYVYGPLNSMSIKLTVIDVESGQTIGVFDSNEECKEYLPTTLQ